MNLQENISRIKQMMGVIVENYYQPKKLYVDMGGVLFKKMGADEGGNGDKTDYIGSSLWSEIKKYNPTILSATGGENVERAKKIKTKQVEDYLDPTPPIEFVISGKDKKKFATFTENESVYPNILIDDSETNINEWVNNGGIGIHHKNNQSTVEKLNKFMK